MKAKYLWLDLETTGLDPATDVILEVAAVVTGPDLIERASFEAVIQFRGEIEREFVRRMHTASGLLDACRGGEDLADVEAVLLELVGAHEWQAGKPILAGSSVHFDRGFVRARMPEIDRVLHHRHLDVSAVRMACEDAGRKFAWRGEQRHRAMLDITESIWNMNSMRETVLR